MKNSETMMLYFMSRRKAKRIIMVILNLFSLLHFFFLFIPNLPNSSKLPKYNLTSPYFLSNSIMSY